MKAASRAAARTSRPIVLPEAQPYWLPLTSAKTSVMRPPVTSTAPGMSKPLARSSLLSGTKVTAPKMAVTAIGTFTNRTQRQEAYWVRTPPRISPIAAPPAVIAEKMPSARLRSLPSANTTVSRASADGDMSAPPMPCTPRAVMSSPRLPAMPPSSEANANSEAPVMKTFRRPMRSPSLPPSSRNPPNVRV